MQRTKLEKRTRLENILFSLGVLFLVLAFGIVFFTYVPVVTKELGYQVQSFSANLAQTPDQSDIVPYNTDFAIVIPKINANYPVIANIDPRDPHQYQIALSKGVAHAKGTVFPGQIGNVFLFAHSAGDFYSANHYNAVFYLLSKLSPGDKIYLFYQSEQYTYTVSDIAKVNPETIAYLNQHPSAKTLTLMTCWPPGTTLKRLVVSAVLE